MIIFVSTVRVLPDKIAAYEAICRAYVAQVRANEPGTVFYEFAKSREEVNTYRVIEVYKDVAAQQFHLDRPYFAETGAAMGPCLASAPQFIGHDSVS